MTEEKEKAKPVELDAEKINELLDVVVRAKDHPTLLALGHAALTNLAIIAVEVQEALNERAEELKKKGEEETAKKAAAKKKEEEEAEEEAKRPKTEQLRPGQPVERRL